MAALGQLVASVAHEINSPLGAIKGSAETLIETIPTLWQLLLALGGTDWPAMQQALSFLVEYLRIPEHPTLTSREERALRKKYFALLSTTLPEEQAETTARRLVEAGIFVEDLSPLLPLLQIQDGVELIYLIGQLRLQLDNILLAANRTRKTVFALKSYAHTSERGKPVPTSLEESVETILVLYHNQLKQGIAVRTHYDAELPILYLFSDEISQVWTNLLQNAIQAMQGKGELTIEVRKHADEIQVSFIDSGPGIPEEILPRIFEPFFTTKPKGEGTGLGLDICRRIVEKHKGRFSVESRPGYTNFTVHLPLLLSQENWYESESTLEGI
ncbi:MAG: ATP-binding protein [Bacteroidia bacterium]|nr:ATP-binding protein [Bacteroidia bacterium]